MLMVMRPSSWPVSTGVLGSASARKSKARPCSASSVWSGERQAEADQRVDQPALGGLQRLPALEVAGRREVGDGAVELAGRAEGVVAVGRHQPVAERLRRQLAQCRQAPPSAMRDATGRPRIVQRRQRQRRRQEAERQPQRMQTVFSKCRSCPQFWQVKTFIGFPSLGAAACRRRRRRSNATGRDGLPPDAEDRG